MGNNVLPARLGEVLRADWIAKRSSNGFGRTSALALIAAERILDGVVLSLIAVIGLTSVTISHTTFVTLLVLIALFTVLAACLIFSVLRDDVIRRMIDRIHGHFPGHLTQFARLKAHHALNGLSKLRGRQRLLAALAATTAIWTLEIAFYWAVAAAIVPVSLLTSMMFLVVSCFASLFPLTSGGIGAIEGVSTMLLAGAGIPLPQALGIVLVQHVFQLTFTTVLGSSIT
jgi:uncharacterized protein (TIRG00374 family)